MISTRLLAVSPRPIRSHLLFVLLATVFPVACVRSDETLTLELPPSPEAQAAALAQRRQAAEATSSTGGIAPRSGVTRRAVRPPAMPSRHRSLRARRQTEPTSVIGRLGLMERAAALHRSPSTSSAVLTRAPAGTYLALRAETANMYGVLMADGSTGWLSRSVVRLLDYQVVSTGAGAAHYAGALPHGSDPGDVYPRSAVPWFTGDANALLQEASRYLGVRYAWGGNSAGGIDCSGFVKNVFGALGYLLPRLGSDQMAYGVPVPMDQLSPGDRLYFGRRKERLGVRHTGIYMGRGYFIHSSSSRRGVAISHLSEPPYNRIYVCARR